MFTHLFPGIGPPRASELNCWEDQNLPPIPRPSGGGGKVSEKVVETDYNPPLLL